MTLSISVSPRRVLRTLIFVIAGLVVASTLAGAALYFLDLGEAGFLWVQLFWIDSETNLPSMYSSATLLAAAVLLMLIALATRCAGAPYARHWGAMTVVFTYLGFDEGARIHERTVEPLRALLGRTSLPSSTFIDVGPAWVVLGGIFVLIFVAAYLRFLRDLPARMRTLLLLAGGLYVGGALGFEILSGMHAVEHGQENAVFAILVTIEETLEMLGVAVFIYALLCQLESRVSRVEVRLDRG